MDKKKIVKILKILMLGIGTIFIGLSFISKKKKQETIYKNQPKEKNPFEGKKVIFIENEIDKENADGIRGHLEETGISNYQPRIYEKYIKRAIDVTLSFGGLVLLSPIYAGISIAIMIDDPGPVLFTQKRVGRNKQYFKLHKFRSMKMCTPHDVPTHMLENPEQYITRVGKFLRAHSLDELPQIWDIFIGNMSVIGPRPALWNQDILTAERDKYNANDIKPGLTGWAQINGRDELEISEKARLDGEYVEKLGLFIDIKCFLGSLHVFRRDDSVIEGGTGSMKNEKKKYLIITNHSYMLYQFREELIEELLKYGEVLISTPFVGREEELKELGCRLIETQLNRRGMNPITDLKLFEFYRKILNNEKPDMVITYSIKPNIYGGFACRIQKIPYCVNVQGLGTAFQKEPMASIVTFMYKIAVKNAKTVFFENRENAEEFMKRKITSEKQQTILPGAGVNLEIYKEQPYPEENNGIHFLYLGRIMKEKGMDELFEVIEKLKMQYGEKVKFDLVGFFEDEYREYVERLVEDGIVKFHGFQTDPKPFYNASHCVVLPSYHEGMSNVLLEAAATGRALITSNIPGCREAVEDGKNGYLCQKQNSQSLEYSMRKFLNLSMEERKEMGIYGRKKMEREFDKKTVIIKTSEKIWG